MASDSDSLHCGIRLAVTNCQARIRYNYTCSFAANSLVSGFGLSILYV